MNIESLCIVVIGRNEGLRLHRALNAAVATGFPVLYVDSASQDGSVALARALGVEVHELDVRQPMSAARARNEGARRILELFPRAGFLQFVDGDTELDGGWCRQGLESFRNNPGFGIVFGSLREVAPHDSIYNWMCEREWNPKTPGAVTHCGGNMMVRSELFTAAGGFRTDILEGEDIEFAGRIRIRGFAVIYMHANMASHDAALHSFWQWWRRRVRNGHGMAQLASILGRHESMRFKRVASALAWGLVMPLLILAGAFLIGQKVLALFALYPLQSLRIYLKSEQRSPNDLLYALFTLVGKTPLALGILLYAKTRLLRQQPKLIGFK